MDDQQIDRNVLIALVLSMLEENMQDVPPIDHLSVGVLQRIFDDLANGIAPQIPPPPLEVSGEETILHNPDDDWEPYNQPYNQDIQNKFLEGVATLIPNIPQTIHPYAEKIIAPVYNHTIENINNDSISLENLPAMDEDDRASLYQAPEVLELTYEYVTSNQVIFSNPSVPIVDGVQHVENYDITSSDKSQLMAIGHIREIIRHDDWFEKIIDDLKLTENNGNIFKEDETLKSALCDSWLILMMYQINITPQELQERSNEVVENLNNQNFIFQMRLKGYNGSSYPGTLIPGYIAKINTDYVSRDQQIFRNAKVALTILSGDPTIPSTINNLHRDGIKSYFSYKYIKNSFIRHTHHIYKLLIMAYEHPEDLESILNIYSSSQLFLENYDIIAKFYNFYGFVVDLPYDLTNFNQDRSTINKIAMHANTMYYGISFMTPFSYESKRITFEFGSKELIENWDPLVIVFKSFDLYESVKFTVYPFDVILNTMLRWNPEVGRPPTFAGGLVSSTGDKRIDSKMAYTFLHFAKKLYVNSKKKNTAITEKSRYDNLRKVALLNNKINKYKFNEGPYKILIQTRYYNTKSPESISLLYTIAFSSEIGLYLILLGNICGGFNMLNFSKERGAIKYEILQALTNYTDDLIKLSEQYLEMKNVLDLPISLLAGRRSLRGFTGIPSNGNLGEDGSVTATIGEMLLDINDIVRDDSIDVAQKQETFYEYSQWLHATSGFLLNSSTKNFFISTIENNFKVYARINKIPLDSYNFNNFFMYRNSYDFVSFY